MADSDDLSGGLDAIDAIPETDAPAPETSAPADTQPQPDDEGSLARDEHGRFTSKTPPDEPTGDATAPPPETSGDSQPETEAAATAEAREPYRFTADRESFEIPGSEVGEDGVYIPTAALPLVTRLLSQGKAHEGSFRQRLSEAAQREQAARKEVEATQAQLRTIMQTLDQVFTGDQDKVLEFVNDYRTQYPILKANAEAESLRLLRGADQARLAEIDQERERAAQRPVMYEALGSYVVQVGREVGLEDGEIKALYEELASPELETVAFVRAPDDDPMSGIRQGEIAVNLQLIRRRAEGLKQLVGRYRTAPVTTVKPKPKVPPTVTAKGGPAPTAPKKQVPKFATAREAEEWIFDHLEEFAET